MLWLVIGLSILFTSPASAAGVQQSYLIVPGRSIGPLRLGMTRLEARQAMLKAFRASSRQDPNNPEAWCWLSRAVCVGLLVGKGTVVTITVERDRRFATSEGVKISMDWNEALRKMIVLGNPHVLNASDGAFIWWPGLQMTVKYRGATSIVTSIVVSPRP